MATTFTKMSSLLPILLIVSFFLRAMIAWNGIIWYHSGYLLRKYGAGAMTFRNIEVLTTEYTAIMEKDLGITIAGVAVSRDTLLIVPKKRIRLPMNYHLPIVFDKATGRVPTEGYMISTKSFCLVVEDTTNGPMQFRREFLLQSVDPVVCKQLFAAFMIGWVMIPEGVGIDTAVLGLLQLKKVERVQRGLRFCPIKYS